MQRNTPIATDHQLILEGLEVLRLITDRMEMNEFVEPEDIATVLTFLRDVGCECLNHTEHLLLRPALTRARQREQVQRLRTALRCHEVVRPLFEETAADVAFPEHFVFHAHLFTKLLSDIIFEEDQFLLQTAVELLDDPEGRRNVEKFAEQERHIRAIAVQAGPTLQRIETKYAYPPGI